jgi:CDGSH-type Zn-finger protein
MAAVPLNCGRYLRDLREFRKIGMPVETRASIIRRMDEPVIRLRENGPLVIQLPVKVLDHLGNEFPIAPGKPTVALCRCGHSANRPFCDGSHKRVGFQAAEVAAAPQPISIAMPAPAPPPPTP